MTLDELKEFNGKDGKKCYIAYKGNIYDISDSDFWRSGLHMGRFEAGQDLTEALSTSPHGEKNILKYPCVGKLSDSGSTIGGAVNKKAKLQKLYAVLHPHPMSVHFPIAFFIFAFLLQVAVLIISSFTIDSSVANVLSAAQVTMFMLASIMVFPAVKTGLLSLYINYDWKTNKYLRRKIILSTTLIVLGVLGDIVICKAIFGSIPFESLGTYKATYTIINALAFVAVSGIGYYGGKLTWGGK